MLSENGMSQELNLRAAESTAACRDRRVQIGPCSMLRPHAAAQVEPLWVLCPSMGNITVALPAQPRETQGALCKSGPGLEGLP